MADVKHARHCPPYDQGQLGSCTGNAMAGALMTEPYYRPDRALTEASAVDLYELATDLDHVKGSYPPDDTGSTGLAVAKAAKEDGYITSFSHAFGLTHALGALTIPPVIAGIHWYDSFDEPLPTGECPLTHNASVRGGHEIELFGLEVESRRVWCYQSWGPGCLLPSFQRASRVGFVLRKTLERRLPVVLVVNKVDRPDARIRDVVNEVFELFLDLDAQDHQIEFPIVYCNARAGKASLDPAVPGAGLEPLFETLLDHVPAPSFDPGHPFQALVTNLDASPYVGRLALCRILHGEIDRGQTVAWCKRDGSVERVRVRELYVTEALARIPADHAGPGDIIAVAGLSDVTIGETLADPDDPRPLPVTHVDEPSLSMTVGINTSPLAGQDGSKLTARLVKSRLDQEVVGNVSIRVLDIPGRPDAWEVQGRGELQLAVLVEMMRREGFELTVGQAPGGYQDHRRAAARAGGAGLDRRA